MANAICEQINRFLSFALIFPLARLCVSATGSISQLEPILMGSTRLSKVMKQDDQNK